MYSGLDITGGISVLIFFSFFAVFKKVNKYDEKGGANFLMAFEKCFLYHISSHFHYLLAQFLFVIALTENSNIVYFYCEPYRTPRVELAKATALGKDGQLLCKYMHDEDNKYGLRVTNTRGNKWIAYGDGMLFDKKSKDNLKFVTEAVQKSVDQVNEAYKNPTKILETAVVTDLIPFVDQAEKNNYPLFQVKDGQLHRRSDISDLQDHKTVTNWWGPTTLAKLLAYKPQNSAI